MDIENVWSEFLNTIKTKVSPISYNLWFKDIKLYDITNDNATILVNSSNKNTSQFISSLVENYYDTIKDIIDKITNSSIDIQFITKEEAIEKEKPNSNDTIVNSSLKTEYDTDISKYKYNNNFNPKYPFDTFVVGDSNRLAYGTALAVAKKPGKLYNPFFIHGKSGLGKTHLMHAIGNYIINNSDLRVLYISAEQFINDYTSILNYKNKNGNNITYLDAFRNKYRNQKK